MHELGWTGLGALALMAIWFLLSVPHQFTNHYGKWVKRHNTFALIPGWTFFAPTPGTSDYRFVVRDVLADGFTEWVEIEWCRPRSFRDAVWNPGRHRTKLVLDCINALMMTLKELQDRGVDVERKPEQWVISVPYLALLNIAMRVPRAEGATARQFALIEMKRSRKTADPKLLVYSAPHSLN